MDTGVCLKRTFKARKNKIGSGSFVVVLKMPVVSLPPTAVVTDGQYVYMRAPTSVKYALDSIDVTVPDHTIPSLWGGGSAAMDVEHFRYTLFVDAAGTFWICEQSVLATLAADATNSYYVMYRYTTSCWERWQLRNLVVAIPFVTDWLIALVAGGSTMASFFGGSHGTLSAPVDGPLGTNTLQGPQVMAYASDGTLWFLDGLSASVRSYNPSTGDVTTQFGLSIAADRVGALGIAIDGDDNVWIYYEIDADSPFAIIQGFTPDGSTVFAAVGSSAVGGPLPGEASAIAFSPDFSRLYFGAGFEGGSGISWFNPADAYFTGPGVSSVNTLADAPTATIGVATDSDGNVYSVGYNEGGAVKVTPDGTVTNLTNIASGQGYAGDGADAYTSGDTTPQLAHPTAIAYDPINAATAIVDRDNFVIRAVLSDGKLYTIAGVAGLSGSGLGNFPDVTPANALTKYLGGSVNSIIPKPGGGFYICVGADDSTDEAIDGMWALYSLVPGSIACLTAVPQITLVAGGLFPSDNTDVDGALGTNALTGVKHMTWGPDGKIWFVSGSSTFIRTFDPATGEVATTTLELVNTFDLKALCFAPDGTLWVLCADTSDQNNLFLYKIPPGTVTVDYSTMTKFFTGFTNIDCYSMAISPDGHYLYCPGYGENIMKRYDTIAETTETYAGNGGIPFTGGTGVTAEDIGNDVDLLDGSIGKPDSVCTDLAGNIYTIDDRSGIIRKMNPTTGKMVVVSSYAINGFFGYGGDGGPAITGADYQADHGPKYHNPGGICVLPCGDIIFFDTTNLVIRRIDPLGQLSTIAGNGTSSGAYPTSVAVDATTVQLGNVTDGARGANVTLAGKDGGFYAAPSGAVSAIYFVR
jgi:streptogramin lyase